MNSLMVTSLFFFIAFYMLIKGADILVKGSTSIARSLRLSPIVIGLVITGIGTSIPEFAVTIFAAIVGRDEIGLGTVIGSNTFNILAILGVSSLLFPLHFKKDWVSRDLVWNMIAIGAVIFLGFVTSPGLISRNEGLLLLVLFIFWIYRTVHHAYVVPEQHYSSKQISLSLAFGLIFAGLIGVLLGGKWVVDGATLMAREVGLSESIIGLTIVGIGTSLPELVVTLAAAYRRQPGIAIGNIIGSNIFDFLMILGFGSVITPIVFSIRLGFDTAVTLVSAVLLFVFMFVGQRYVLKRWQGLVFIFLYGCYILYLFR